ncbi:MAG TPA: fatty acid--CoA ligase [Porticoccaceae bacterium]|nr:fatty acid--CoA ligase [Porticoccaceae bacterium]
MTTPIPVDILDQKMTAADSPFAMDEILIDGISTRVWKHAPKNLQAIFEDTRQFAERDYLVYEGERMTYRQHHQKVVALAHALVRDCQINKGDRIALAMRNYPEWPVVFWATVSVGAIIVPLNAWWTVHELEYAIANSGARLVFADQERASLLAGTCDQVKSLDRVVVIRGEDNAISPNELRFEELLARYPNEDYLPPVEIAPDDEASIFYTSGTTGNPKGAINTHRNICSNQVSGVYCRVRTEYRYGREPEMPTEQMGQLISAPLFHVTGSLAMLCGSTMAGSKIVFMYKWDADTAIRLIEKEKLNSFGGVPSMPLQVLESPILSQHDMSTVRGVLFGGAPPAPELAARIKQAFPNASSSNGYGLTETSALTTVCVAEDYLSRPESAGMPAAVCDIKIMSEDENQMPAGEIGEIWIKGPQVIKGYWNNPEATAKTITDGWLHSGDLGYLDEEGFLYVVDRAKDMLLRGGENIYCIEVESALYDHAAVIDAAVVGIPHPVLGEEVGALVQIRPGNTVTEKELQDHVAAQIAAFKVPVRIDQYPGPLPRNANGKIMKPEVKKIMGIAQ